MTILILCTACEGTLVDAEGLAPCACERTPAPRPLAGFPVDADTLAALMPHERAALARSLGDAPAPGSDLTPREAAMVARGLEALALLSRAAPAPRRRVAMVLVD